MQIYFGFVVSCELKLIKKAVGGETLLELVVNKRAFIAVRHFSFFLSYIKVFGLFTQVSQPILCSANVSFDLCVIC